MKLTFWSWFTKFFPKALDYVVRKLTLMDGKAGLSWDDIEKTVEWIKHAEVSFGTGAERREWVMERVNDLKKAAPHVVETLFWIALNYAKERGYIGLGD